MSKSKQDSKSNSKKRTVQVSGDCDAHISATFNNIIVTITTKKGDTIAWSSAGKMGFRGSKKNTPYAAQTVAFDVAKKATTMGAKRINVFVKGPGSGRESAIRSLAANGLEVNMIKDITPIPHNGCRPPKRRKV